MAPLIFFVSAASSGFGKGIALEALKRGHHVIATARQAAKISDLKDQGAVTLDLDVTKPLSELQSIVAEAHKVYGRIDVLINAAGFILEGAIEEASPEETFSSFNTNVFGVVNLSRAVLPYMRQQKSGIIAQFGSLGSWRGGPAVGVYCSCKWAIASFSESLYEEVGPFGIQVCSIEPGYFRTGFLSPGAKVITKTQLPEYETAVGQVRRALAATDNNQPGNIDRGCKVIVDVLTGDKPIPMRLVLGSDAYSVIKQKCEDTLKLLEEWKPVTCSTDFQ